MAVKLLKPAPPVAPGAGVTEALREGVQIVYSDNVNYNDTSPVTLFDVPANTEVLGIVVEVTTAFNGTIPSIAVGVSGTTGRHVNSVDVDVKTAAVAELRRPHKYTADAQLICTIVQGGATQGVVRFGCIYRGNSDK